MERLARLVLLLAALASGAVAADPATDAYNSAAKAFEDRFYERAQQQFAEFVQKFPESPVRPQAILFQVQALFFQKKYEAAVELIDKPATPPGDLADQFSYWRAQALFEKGDYAAAGTEFAQLYTQFPNSPRVLEAATGEASAAFRARNFARVVELLAPAEGAFRKLAAPGLTNAASFGGQLLLGEALLALDRPADAKSAAAQLPESAAPSLVWDKHFLLARAELAGPAPEAGLGSISNAVVAARVAARPGLLAQALNLEADIHKKLNRPDDAVGSYEKIVAVEELPIDQRRLALLKSVELLTGAQRLTNALERLGGYLTRNPQDPSADLLRVKASELWLGEFRLLAGSDFEALTATQKTAATNALAQARVQLTAVFTQFTNSPHLGKAWLNLGWVNWEEGLALNQPARIRESQASFQTAIERLTRSDDQALARFKLADASFQLQDYPQAATNYLFVVENYADLPQAQTALFDRAYQQLVRTWLELGDMARAAVHLADLRRAFPNNPRTEETLFSYGQALLSGGKPVEARALFDDFLATFPLSPLVPRVRLASAKTYASEGNWSAALARHDEWLAAFTNSPLRPEVVFQRGLTLDRSGSRTNALAVFTNFVGEFSTSPLAPAAQNWVADYFLENGQLILAEQNYQQVFQNTNWLASPLIYRAKMMAARTAFQRQGYVDARAYLTNVIQDPNCPEELRPEALFALGDVIMQQPIAGTTNQLNNFVEAANAFDLIVRTYTNRFTPLAWGKKGDCHLQLAAQYPQSYLEATNAYTMALATATSETPVAVLNQAEVGLGLALEAMAELREPAERGALRRQSLSHFLNVVYGTNLGGRRADPLYLRKAGLAAGRMAEVLGDESAAVALYRRLIAELPSLRPIWEARLNSLQQKVASK